MSTPCKIILKVRNSDIGREIKFDASKLPIPLLDWVEKDGDSGHIWLDERGRNLCRKITLKKHNIGIYCHYDGYPEHMENILKTYFNSYEATLNFIAGGFCSFIGEEGLKHYANRKPKHFPNYWKDIKPIQGDTFEEVSKRIYGQYTYMNVGNNSWWCYDANKDNIEFLGFCHQ